MPSSQSFLIVSLPTFSMSSARADPVVQRLQAARGTGSVRAAVHYLARGLHDHRVAERAALRHAPRLRSGLVLARRPDDLRDHVAGALHDHEVALADVLPRDVLLVVECRARHGDAADVHWLELGERSEHARPPHPNMDPHQPRRRGGRRPLVRAREAGAAVERAQRLLLSERVDLDHDAVDLVVELGAPGLPGGARLRNLLDGLEALHKRVRPEPALA